MLQDTAYRCSGVPRGGVWGVQTPPPPKFRRYRRSPRSYEQERAGVSIFFWSSLCSHTV